MKFKIYEGCLDTKKMNKRTRHAYRSWMRQRDRCSNKRDPHYPYYGARGIKVEYSSREFIGWWLDSLKSFKGECPTVGRINHDKNYCFQNIKLEDHYDNCVVNGLKNPKKRVACYNFHNMKLLKIYNSVKEASKDTKISKSTIPYICRGKYHSGHPVLKTKNGLTFRFMENHNGPIRSSNAL